MKDPNAKLEASNQKPPEAPVEIKRCGGCDISQEFTLKLGLLKRDREGNKSQVEGNIQICLKCNRVIKKDDIIPEPAEQTLQQLVAYARRKRAEKEMEKAARKVGMLQKKGRRP